MKRLLSIIVLLAGFAHAQLIAPTTSECATSTDGSVVGIQNPQQPPIVAVAYTGTLGSGNYFVEFAWYDPSSHVTLVSPELQVQLTATGQLQVSPPAAGVPATAQGMYVYIGTTSGGETLQGDTGGYATFVQSTPLTTGTAVPTVNNTVCQIIANDAGWPTGTGYVVTMTSPSGIVLPNYPMQWQLLGPGTTLNIGQGLPIYNGQVTYPSPILAMPYGHATQSINGPLSLGGYGLTAGTLNISALSILTGGGVFGGTWTGSPTFTGHITFTGEPFFSPGADFENAEFDNGFTLDGSYGIAGEVATSTGTGTVWAPGQTIGGTPIATVGSGAGTGGTPSLVGVDKLGLISVNTGSSGASAGTVVTLTFSTPFANQASCTITPANGTTAGIGADIYVVSAINNWNIVTTSGLSTSTFYQWNYICNGY